MKLRIVATRRMTPEPINIKRILADEDPAEALYWAYVDRKDTTQYVAAQSERDAFKHVVRPLLAEIQNAKPPI